jgi:hypothetical protein
MRDAVRLPDFVIVGMMKSGTTTLYRWLAQQPEGAAAKKKEIHFFSRYWDRGLPWYGSYFEHVPEGRVVGEASTTYTRPEFDQVAAARMASCLPHVKLVCLLRDPIERLRSHYRHDLRKGRTRAAFLDAVAEPGNPYVALSLYHRRLEPYVQAFGREQLRVVRLEDLVEPASGAWAGVLRHVGLPAAPLPATAHNVGAGGVAYGRVLGKVTDLRLWRYPRAYRALRQVPEPVRRIGKRALVRAPQRAARDLDAASTEVPPAVAGAIWEDVARLEARLSLEGALWPRGGG